MGLSPFCTKRDLYYDKRNIQPVVDEEEDNWVASSTGMNVVLPGRLQAF